MSDKKEWRWDPERGLMVKTAGEWRKPTALEETLFRNQAPKK